MSDAIPPAQPRGPGTPAGNPRAKNWLGIVGLITSLVCCLQGLGVIFGALGLRAVKRGEATNRAMSLFAVWWGGAWLLITLALVVWFMADPDARSRDFVSNFGAAGADVAAIDEAISDVRDAGGDVQNIGWDGENYYVGDTVIPAESANPQIGYYISDRGYCLEIVNSSVSGGMSSSSNASLSRGASCSGTSQPVLTP